MHINNTKSFVFNKTRRAGLMLACAAALVGCAGMQGNQPPELQVRELATKRWQALLAQNYEVAYGMLAPSYRSLKTLDAYQKIQQSIPFKRVSAKVDRVECSAEKCTARIGLESEPVTAFAFKGTVVSGLDETWVLEDGRWWLLEAL